jgi:hypothetical protein
MEFVDSLLEKKFIIEVNSDRRHLVPFQKIELQYKLEIIENQIAKARKGCLMQGKSELKRDG